MLVLSRKKDESIIINDHIRVTVVEMRPKGCHRTVAPGASNALGRVAIFRVYHALLFDFSIQDRTNPFAVRHFSRGAASPFQPFRKILQHDLVLNCDIRNSDLDAVQTLRGAINPFVAANGGHPERDGFV